MKTTIYKITLALLVFYTSIAAYSQNNLLYVGKDDENPADSALLIFLDDREFDVTFVMESEFSGASFTDAAAYAQYDAVIISETVGSASVGNFKTAGFPIPCVTNEGYAVRSDKWGFLTDDAAQFIQPKGTARTAGALTLSIHDADNWITSRYAADYKLRWTSWEDSLADEIGVTGFKLDENVSGAIEIGQFMSDSVSGFPGMWAIPGGSSLDSDGTEIPKHMVIIGTVSKALGRFVTEEYDELIFYSLLWVTDNTESIPEGTNSLKNSNFNIFPNPTNGILNISLTLPTSGNVQVNLYDVAGKLVKNKEYETVRTNTINVDISDVPNAHYILEISTENEVIKEKIWKN